MEKPSCGRDSAYSTTTSFPLLSWPTRRGTPPFATTLSDLSDPVFPIDTNLTSGTPPPPQFNPLPASVKEPSKISYNLNLQREIFQEHRARSGLQHQAFYTYAKSIDEKSTIAGGDSRQEVTTIQECHQPGR
ncbi:MAG TPA: hypothetical protein VGR73_18170 [Bryobacteraceae bacterium]|nr:hypothetical protein [Bryobacteraceae bacterium]